MGFVFWFSVGQNKILHGLQAAHGRSGNDVVNVTALGPDLQGRPRAGAPVSRPCRRRQGWQSQHLLALLAPP